MYYIRCIFTGGTAQSLYYVQIRYGSITTAIVIQLQGKKRSERRKHCMLAVVRWSQKFFAQPQTPLPRGTGRPKFNQLEMVTTFTYRTQSGEDRCTQFQIIVVTDRHSHRHTHTNPRTGPITLHCAAKLSRQCN